MKSGVFVSFRGTDTRRTFVSHLLLSLFKKEFKTFKCEEEEEITLDQPANSQVLQAIQESKVAIVVISKNYTASTSCLDELAMIIECQEKQSLVVVPVLYEVNPSDVLRQADDFGGGDNNNSKKVMRWRDAVAKAVQIYQQDYSYWEDEEDSYIIDRVMSCVSDCLGMRITLESKIRLEETSAAPIKWRRIARRFIDGTKHSSDFDSPFAGMNMSVEMHRYSDCNGFDGMDPCNDFKCFDGKDRHAKAVTALLDLQLNDTVGAIGVCGVHGVGKTTVARSVFEQISPQFQEHHYFTNDARKYSTCLLEEITRAHLLPTLSESERLHEVVKAKLGHRKVLLVVDDLDDSGKLENIWKFFGWFGPGSRLVVITQSKRVLLDCRLRRIYEVESMRYDEALQLFSQFAFKQEQVPRGFYRLSVRAVLITGRIPLALKVFGSFLSGKCINEWEFELCRLEASQANCVSRVSSYIGDAFS